MKRFLQMKRGILMLFWLQQVALSERCVVRTSMGDSWWDIPRSWFSGANVSVITKLGTQIISLIDQEVSSNNRRDRIRTSRILFSC